MLHDEMILQVWSLDQQPQEMQSLRPYARSTKSDIVGKAEICVLTSIPDDSEKV